MRSVSAGVAADRRRPCAMVGGFLIRPKCLRSRMGTPRRDVDQSDSSAGVRHSLTERVLNRLVEAEARRAHPVLHEWLGEERLQRNLRTAIAEMAAAGRNAPADSSLRILEFGEDSCALAGIAPESSGQPSPTTIVTIEAIDCRLDSLTVIDEFLERVSSAFASHRPALVQVYIHSASDIEREQIEAYPECGHGKRYLAAPIAMIRGQSTPSMPYEVQLRRPNDFSFYPEYAGMYRRFLGQRPDLRAMVPVEPLEDLKRFHREGCLRLIEIEGELAGVMAATPACERGMRGWCMRERIIAQKYRGQRLGAPMLRQFIDEIPAEDDDLLFGTIAPNNHPSLKSARQLGRVDVGGLYDLPLPGGANS